ncbi:MAG: fibronectin type III domain-containing protein [Ignavibacteriales bacterium]|nr:fibronectin type III domain-containing protein [Ignavibacteriales bacterium]
MNKFTYFCFSFFFLGLLLFSRLYAQDITLSEYTNSIQFINEALKNNKLSIRMPKGTQADTLLISETNKSIEIVFNENLSFYPFREQRVTDLYQLMKSLLPEKYHGYNLLITCSGHPISQLIPNFYRESQPVDSTRLPKLTAKRMLQVVKNISKPYRISNGLQNNNILLWHSHGWYYSDKSERWEWQRPRLFQTVEDLLPLSFTIPYIIPMLENAGANVYIPRERDIQTNEVVIDNDTKNDIRHRYYLETGKNNIRSSSAQVGFGYRDTYDSAENPFRMGTYRKIKFNPKSSTQIIWAPNIPEAGEYAVYISYFASPENTADARYTVYHAGGKTEFAVNQQIGGSSWYYLGTFRFNKGKGGKVQLSGDPQKGAFITADAVRFGGGMGSVKRQGSVSGRARFIEGSRYWLQYAGMPDTLVYHLRKSNDYTDDYQSRAEYGNYLQGPPCGPTKNRQEGLGLPVHLSLAFHTDAGLTATDSVFGTLSIYTLEGPGGAKTYPDSVSRLANRDFADIMQTEIVRDVKKAFDPNWVRRQLRNGDYSESSRPTMPSALLELLSHQNFKDMQYALNPAFRFTVSRAIYKSMVKYLAASEGRPYTIQPLPIKKISAILRKDNAVYLSWEEQADSLEPTASADGYVVYKRLDNGGFDNGIYTKEPRLVIQNLRKGVLYSFKVAAVNKGGESMPSEIVCAGISTGNRQVLVVNGFTRVSAPAVIETPGFNGFADFLDEGVPDKYTVSYTGSQYNFNNKDEYVTDDAPGFGTSSANYEGQKIAGNSFDNIAIHGKSLLQAGYSFSSCSEDALPLISRELKNFSTIDLIYGEQKETVMPKNSADAVRKKYFALYPPGTINALQKHFAAGGSVFVSGSYIATDVFTRVPADSTLIHFVQDYLHYSFQSSYAAKRGRVHPVTKNVSDKNLNLIFNTEFSPDMYKVEAPDALQPFAGSVPMLRYDENNFTASVFCKNKQKVIAVGFPFESIISETQRAAYMKAIMKRLTD